MLAVQHWSDRSPLRFYSDSESRADEHTRDPRLFVAVRDDGVKVKSIGFIDWPAINDLGTQERRLQRNVLSCAKGADVPLLHSIHNL